MDTRIILLLSIIGIVYMGYKYLPIEKFLQILISILVIVGFIQWFIYLYFFNVGVSISKDVLNTQIGDIMNDLIMGTELIPEEMKIQIEEKINNLQMNTKADEEILAKNKIIKDSAFNYVLILSSICIITSLIIYFVAKYKFDIKLFETFGEKMLVLSKIVFIIVAYTTLSYIFIRHYTPLDEPQIDQTLVACVN